MKTLKIKVYVATHRVGSKETDELEVTVNDNATEEEIDAEKEKVCREWMFEQIEFGWADIA